MAAKKPVYCVIYCGAPYGDDESGHVVSRHRTLSAAVEAHIVYARTAAGYGRNSRVRVIDAENPQGRRPTDAERETACNDSCVRND